MLPKSRLKIVLALVVLGPALLIAFIAALWIWASATALPLHSSAQEIPSTRADPAAAGEGGAAADRAATLIRAAMIERNLPGISVAVAVGGRLVWAEGFGWADLENRVPLTPDTPIRLGSASKVLTSAGVGLLLERGQLDLDAPIQRYVKTFPEKPWPVTLRQLMGHTAGIVPDEGDEEPLGVRCEQTAAGLERFAQRKLMFEPGMKFRVSNYGWILVSAAVETAAGEPFVAFMRKDVFRPLGMTETSTDFPTEPVRTRAQFYFPKFAADPRYGPQSPEIVDYSCFTGALAFLTTPLDMIRFALAIERGTLVTPDTVKLLQASQRLTTGEDTGYGLGWDLETFTLNGEPARTIGHEGDLKGGPSTSLLIFPDRQIIVSVMSNMAYADPEPLAVKIAEIFAK